MVILRATLGSKRVELQNKPIILPTTTLAVLSRGEREIIKNPALDFTILVWDGDSLKIVTPSAVYEAAFRQYQARVKIEFNVDVPDQACIGCDA